MNIKKQTIIFIFLLFSNLYPDPALTKKQQLNQVKKTMTTSTPATGASKNLPALPPAKNPSAVKKPTAVKVIPISNLNDLAKALEKFHTEQKKKRATDRSQPCNQFINIQDPCPCTGAVCQCQPVPPILTI